MTKPFSSAMILGVRVDLVSPDQAIACLERLATDGGSHHVVTVNPEFIMTAQRNSAFRDILNRSDLSLPDGIGVVWACRQRGHPLAERVTGVDTVRALMALAAQRGLRPFLLGAAPGVAEEAARALQAEYPGLDIAGAYAGSPRPEEEETIVGRIGAARPDILLVAYGSPAQDLWIERTRGRLQVPIAMGVGGTLDFLAGRVRRAPAWMQRAGIEWAYRLVQEPRRWRRMLALPLFAMRVLRSRGG